jgi:DNA repair protein RadC
MAITDWPEGERPREKLLQQGVGVLSLLAIFLRMGVVGKSAVDLARDLLTLFGSSGSFRCGRQYYIVVCREGLAVEAD